MAGIPDSFWAGRTPDNTPMVALRWRDIRSTDHWANQDDEIRPARHIVSAGWVVYEGIDPEDVENEVVVLANHYDYEDKMWAAYDCYPKQVVHIARLS